MSRFSEIIKKARVKRGLTQQQLAELVNCNLAHIGKIEIDAARPSVSLLERLFRVLGISVVIKNDSSEGDALMQSIMGELKYLDEKQLRLARSIIKVLFENQ